MFRDQPGLLDYLLPAQRSDCKLSAICYRLQKARVIYKAKATATIWLVLEASRGEKAGLV